jgi:hypothetical protein
MDWVGDFHLVVGIVDILREGDKDEQERRSSSRLEQWIGILLIVGHCIMSVLQDLSNKLKFAKWRDQPTL